MPVSCFLFVRLLSVFVVFEALWDSEIVVSVLHLKGERQDEERCAGGPGDPKVGQEDYPTAPDF